MDFKFRENEINEIRRLKWLSEEQYTRVLLLTGQPFVGKKTLVRQALSDQLVLYFKMSQKSDQLLCDEFLAQSNRIVSLNYAGRVNSFSHLFDILFDHSSSRSFSLVIDEFHRLPTYVLEHLSELLQSRKRKTNVNLILMSSDELMAERLSVSEEATLYNCIDSMIPLKPFNSEELKQLFFSIHPGSTIQDYLDFYMVTGGIPMLVSALGESSDALSSVYADGSDFLSYGNRYLDSRLGKNAEMYYSVLEAIACGKSSQSEIEEYIGCTQNVGGHLAKLESVYNLISRSRPVFSSEKSRGVVRYSIKSQALSFWLRWVEKYISDIEAGNVGYVKTLLLENMRSYSKEVMIKYFREKLEGEGAFSRIGGWWTSVSDSGRTSDIPVVAYNPSLKSALAAQVVHSAEDFDRDDFLASVARLKDTLPRIWTINPVLFTMKDM